MIDAVILDFGHTIVDFVLSERALLATYEEVRGLLVEHAGGELPSARHLVDAVSLRLGQRIEESYRAQELEELDILEEFTACFAGIDLHLPPALIRRIAEMEHRALSAETSLLPENAAALQSLRDAGFRLGLVSNITLLGELVREDLHRLGILHLFDAVVLSSELGVRKPHPRIYARALEGLGVGGERALFVGDRLREDVAGPQAAGMRAVLTRQFRQEECDPESPTPERVIERLADLPAVALALRAAPPAR